MIANPIFRQLALTMFCVLNAAGLSPCAYGQVTSEYRLSIGDVLEISIVGAPDLSRRIPVGLGGNAAFPLIGEIKAVGLTLGELTAQIRDLIPQKPYRNGKFNGAEALEVIDKDQISLEIAEYRPVYLSGDIAKPGEVKYRPGLTVGQAIALAGGYRGQQALDTADVDRQYEITLVSLAAEKVRIWHLMTMLGRTTGDFDSGQLPEIDPNVLARIVELESAEMKARQEDHEKRKQAFRVAIEQSNQRIAALNAQSANERDGTKLDVEDMDRTTELARRGVVPLTRVSEVRRAALLASSRALQTEVAADNAVHERQELESKLQRMDDTLRIELLKDLQAANLKAETLGIEMDRLRQRLSGTPGDAAPSSSISILRAGSPESSGHGDSELLPGDVVEVRLQAPATHIASKANQNDNGRARPGRRPGVPEP